MVQKVEAAWVNFKHRSRLAHVVRNGVTLCGRVPTKVNPLKDQAAWTDDGVYCGHCLEVVDTLSPEVAGVLGRDARWERMRKRDGVGIG